MEKIGKEFMEKTKYKYQTEESDQQKGVTQPPLEKVYTGEVEPIKLPDVSTFKVAPLDLTQAIMERRSKRDYLDQSLSLEELAYLLFMTAGVKKVYENRATLRTAPSAGARHAFETYLLINNVTGVQPGLYRYLALNHELVAVDLREGVKEDIVIGCAEQEFAGTSAVTFIWTAVTYRMTWRYQERGYRYLHLDAGHVCENLYLATQAIGCGTCAIAAYEDDEMNRLLGLDGEEEFVIYVAPVGKVEK